jgi:hypothetical protein
MLPFYSFTFLLMAVCAVFYYRVGEYEGSSGWVWGGLSVLVSLIVWRWLHGGFIAVLVGQVALFVAITAWRARKKP